MLLIYHLMLQRPMKVLENKERTEGLDPVRLRWLPVLDRFRCWLYSGEANIFNEFSDTLELASV